MSKQKYLKKKSDINYSYSTIKVTKSRIDKGLLAIPVSLVDKFPDNKKEIAIYFDSSETLLKKSFTPYNSSSRECRIGGMRDFFIQNNIENDDEIVIQFLDKKSFRIISENRFKKIINKAQQLILSTKEDDFKKSISIIKKITNEEKSTILKNEFLRLTNNEVEKRKQKIAKPRLIKENVPKPIRSILEELYKGKCQVSGFTFIMKSGSPYFEIHHIKPELGNHMKNLLVVSANIHAQFTYSPLKEIFDNEGWLRQVSFRDESFTVKQAIDNITKTFFKETYQ